MSAYRRVRDQGVGASSPRDLLAVAVSRREEDVSEDVAQDILGRLGAIGKLSDISPGVVQDWTGLDGFELVRFLSAFELGRRGAAASAGDKKEILGPEDVVALFDHLRHEKREHLCAVLLDARSAILRVVTVHIGTLTMSVVGPREVFREAIREGASSLIIVHNHPSGDPTPSPEDIDITHQLAAVGNMLDIPVRDHVILGDRGKFTSLNRAGHLPNT